MVTHTLFLIHCVISEFGSALTMCNPLTEIAHVYSKRKLIKCVS